MNKKNNQLVPICFLVAILLGFAMFGMLAKPAWEEYNEASSSKVRAEKELANLNERIEKEKQRRAADEINLKSIKQVFETSTNSSDNLSAYGSIFDSIIKLAQSNNLFIRSIEYDTKPTNSAVYNNFSEQYNVCNVKFFFVGKYPQLRDFLNDITNNFQYLLSVSELKVTAFSGDTDYILIRIGITLYSKKPTADE